MEKQYQACFCKNEDGIGERRAQALEFNKVGLQKYTSKKYVAVTGYFYQAYLLFHENWLSASIYCRANRREILFYKKVNTLEFLTELQTVYSIKPVKRG